MSLCQYSDIFGKPGEGLHKYRIFGMAAVDLILTFVLALLISWLYKYPIVSIETVIIFLSLMVLAVIVHRLFCVKTALNNAIFE